MTRTQRSVGSRNEVETNGRTGGRTDGCNRLLYAIGKSRLIFCQACSESIFQLADARHSDDGRGAIDWALNHAGCLISYV